MIGYLIAGLLALVVYLLWQIHYRLIEVFAMQKATVLELQKVQETVEEKMPPPLEEQLPWGLLEDLAAIASQQAKRVAEDKEISRRNFPAP